MNMRDSPTLASSYYMYITNQYYGPAETTPAHPVLMHADRVIITTWPINTALYNQVIRSSSHRCSSVYADTTDCKNSLYFSGRASLRKMWREGGHVHSWIPTSTPAFND